MTAFSSLWNTNMIAVTSCENAVSLLRPQGPLFYSSPPLSHSLVSQVRGHVVCSTRAVVCVLTQRSWGETLRDDTKNSLFDCEQSLIFLCKVTARETQARERLGRGVPRARGREAFKPRPFLRQKLLISLPCLRKETLLSDSIIEARTSLQKKKDRILIQGWI